jgi:hypothetical protein
MNQVWLRANSGKWEVGRLILNFLLLLKPGELDFLHPHRSQAGNKKGRRESLAIDLAIYLVGRLVDTQHSQHPRKLFVTNAAPHHLFLYQPLRFFFPFPERLNRRSAELLPQIFHRLDSTLHRPLFIWSRNSLMAIFGRIRPNTQAQLYTLLAKHDARTKC